MDIRQLHYFVQVADCGNFSLASQKLFVSQPALSKTIKNMEDELGFTFFYTYQRRPCLTDAGQAFYEKAVNLLKEYDALMEMTYDEAGIDKGHIKIGLSTAAGPALFSHIYPKFSEKYPLINFTLEEKDTNVLKDEILKKDIDVAFIDLKHMHKEEEDLFDIYELVKSDIIVVTSENNPLAKYERIAYTDLDGKDIILYSGGRMNADQMETDIRSSNAKPHVVFSSSQWYLIFELISANIGVVTAPYYIYDKLKAPGITAIPLDDENKTRTIGMITKRDDHKSRACRTFVNFASDCTLYDDMTAKLQL